MADDGLSGLTDDEKCTPLFELMREHDLEGIVAKRLDDPYDPRVRWLRIKNPDYSQKGGKGRPVQQVMAAARAFGSPISESDTGAPMRVVQGLPVPSRAQSRRDGRTLWRGDDRDRLALKAGLLRVRKPSVQPPPLVAYSLSRTPGPPLRVSPMSRKITPALSKAR